MEVKTMKKIWLNGKLINWEDAKIHVLSHGLHYGTGVFEGIRAYATFRGLAPSSSRLRRTSVFRLSEHIDRFFYSASCIGLKIPFSKRALEKAILDTIYVNKMEECYIRPIAFGGEGQMGLKFKELPVNVAIACWPWGAYLGKGKPIRVKISKYIRLHPESIISNAKICGYYVNSILGSLETQKYKVDEVLLLDHRGYVAEGPGENIFMVKNERLITPPVGSILPGITRDSIIKIAQDLGILVQERHIRPQTLKKADEVFFTGTACEVQPIGRINNVIINKGKIGAITKRIQVLYNRIVHGQERKYRRWLTFN